VRPPRDGAGLARAAVWIDHAVLVLGILTTAAIVVFLTQAGRYYLLPLWERPDSPLHRALRPSGSVGHLLGYTGLSLIVTGVMLYSSRKRVGGLQRVGPMRTWLRVHIYLCLTGPVLITFHSALKFRGLGAYSFWSMWIVAISGIAGRWLYQQFPRTIRGTEMTLDEIRAERAKERGRLELDFRVPAAALDELDAFADASVRRIQRHPLVALPLLAVDDLTRPWRVAALRRRLHLAFSPGLARPALDLLRHQVALQRRVAFLGLFRRLFLYWHVTHLIFFFAMFVLLVLHVGAALFFGAGIGLR
jgi:hypothetical protein